jgi:ABC-type Zn2+ transport system substrate-binding protein/surface adhesin
MCRHFLRSIHPSIHPSIHSPTLVKKAKTINERKFSARKKEEEEEEGEKKTKKKEEEEKEEEKKKKEEKKKEKTTQLHLVGSFYEIYITMHGSVNIMFALFIANSPQRAQFNTR